MIDRRLTILLLAGLLLLAVQGCAVFGGGEYQFNNPVRQAVYRFEREQRGKTDELLIQFYRTEPRVKFDGQNENGGRTVWLFDLAAREYFELLPSGKSYLYIQRPNYNADFSSAEVRVYRGDKAGYASRALTLQRLDNADTWQVVDDRPLAAN